MTGYSDWRKSTRSNSGDDSSCVECRVTWRKSTHSAGDDDCNCVETRQQAGAFQVRDSKLGHDSPIFDLAATDFKALLTAAELARNQAQGPPPRTSRRRPFARSLHVRDGPHRVRRSSHSSANATP
jgi:hypothetical protein